MLTNLFIEEKIFFVENNHFVTSVIKASLLINDLIGPVLCGMVHNLSAKIVLCSLHYAAHRREHCRR